MIGTLLKGEFEIVETLGAGGMGQVYVARQRSAGNRRVALKVLKPELYGTAAWDSIVSRFEGEILSLSQLNHPNIVTLYTSGVDDATQTLFMAMELLAGESLEARLRRSRLSHEEFFPFARDILSGLSVAHERGIVHRDLKPANLMVVAQGRERMVKILDFGIAKILSAEGTQLTLGPSPATLLYSSPEHFHDSSEIGPESDLFSLGIVFYRMVSGMLPFRGSTQHVLMRQILYEAPAPLGHESPRVEALILRMLSKEKSGRPTLPAIQDELVRIEGEMAPAERWSAEATPPPAEGGGLTRPDGVTVTLRGGAPPAAGSESRKEAPPFGAAATGGRSTSEARKTARAETERPGGDRETGRANTRESVGDREAGGVESGTSLRREATAPSRGPDAHRAREDAGPAPGRVRLAPIAVGVAILLAAGGYLLTRGKGPPDPGGTGGGETTKNVVPPGDSLMRSDKGLPTGSGTPPNSAGTGTGAGTAPAGGTGRTAAPASGQKPPIDKGAGDSNDGGLHEQAAASLKKAADEALDAANADRRALEKLDKETLIPRLYLQELWSAASGRQADGLHLREQGEFERSQRQFESASRDYRGVLAMSRALYDGVLSLPASDPTAQFRALEAFLKSNPKAASCAKIQELRKKLSQSAGEGG